MCCLFDLQNEQLLNEVNRLFVIICLILLNFSRAVLDIVCLFGWVRGNLMYTVSRKKFAEKFGINTVRS